MPGLNYADWSASPYFPCGFCIQGYRPGKYAGERHYSPKRNPAKEPGKEKRPGVQNRCETAGALLLAHYRPIYTKKATEKWGGKIYRILTQSSNSTFPVELALATSLPATRILTALPGLRHCSTPPNPEIILYCCSFDIPYQLAFQIYQTIILSGLS